MQERGANSDGSGVFRNAAQLIVDGFRVVRLRRAEAVLAQAAERLPSWPALVIAFVGLVVAYALVVYGADVWVASEFEVDAEDEPDLLGTLAGAALLHAGWFGLMFGVLRLFGGRGPLRQWMSPMVVTMSFGTWTTSVLILLDAAATVLNPSLDPVVTVLSVLVVVIWLVLMAYANSIGGQVRVAVGFVVLFSSLILGLVLAILLVASELGLAAAIRIVLG